MSTDVTTAVGTFVWRENVSSRSQRAQEFYAQLFGWEIEHFQSGDFDYPMISSGGKTQGGFPTVPEGTPARWVSNVLVDDADATIEKAKAAGGELLVGPMDIPEVGRYAVLKDPQGAIVAAFQGAGGGGPTGDGGVFVWDELGTQDVEGAERF
jgi:predicted enzyme related to lactoylglutathione lyase